MNANSHKQIASLLDRNYLYNLPRRFRKAFFIGCMEPDKNPTTYIKGSIRSQWLRGHNWENAQRYIQKIAMDLESKSRFNTLDYYKLGKLIHYTADAFTYAHNLHFQSDLKAHRQYEQKLDSYITENLESISVSFDLPAHSILDIIHSYRTTYIRTASGVMADAVHAKRACCGILYALLTKNSLLSTGKIFSAAKII